MSKAEIRKTLLEKSTIAGDMEFELEELKKMQKNQVDDIETITVTCGHVLTIICC